VAMPEDVERNVAALLLSGPRGRYVCAQVAQLADAKVDLPHDASDEAATSRLLDQLTGLDAEPISALVDPLVLMDSLGAAVDSVRYWQEPDERDELLHDPRIVAALEPLAHALAVAPAARWWWSPLALDEQATVGWLERRRKRADRPQWTGATQRLQQWRSETLADEARAARELPTAYDAHSTGSWWSTPLASTVITTSRRFDWLPAVQLELVEDALGWKRAQVAPAGVTPDPRVFEVAAPSDWINLVERYPLDVDRSRRHDWYRATGGTGPWQIPDWAGVSHDYDGVHLTVAGYLATAGRALSTRTGQTVLAGFDPDLTYWLTDSLVQAAPPTTWLRTQRDDDEHEWVRQAAAP